ncbi:hypothetical protein BO85DRAFT_522919 [Aspergillus piperis CBS 112811]|uniref:Uncharacterized protein n=1 Tax=Aspergillus piperis CBS 112811 TaxID=1448313 RepID=A0A8G1VII6_9EURO|nr:hypothetical protein BO85DRAFT_522919 [Aspergillus piperis CBS 112811]RAH54574.1 hypothetical protein BO85DRAFT_522919 [Aspergillus piperis CBS 112811]
MSVAVVAAGRVWFLLPSVFSVYPYGPEAYVFMAWVGSLFRVRVESDLAELPEQAYLQHEFGDVADCLRV